MRLMMNYSSLVTADLQNYLFLPLIISLLIVLVLSHCISCDIEGDYLSKKPTTKKGQLKTTLWAFCFV